MLTLTENASTIVKDITANNTGGEVAGLRISVEGTPEASFAISAAEAPQQGDQVVEQDGATVYLDTPAAEQLDDKVLDASLDGQGGVEFSLSAQS